MRGVRQLVLQQPLRRRQHPNVAGVEGEGEDRLAQLRGGRDRLELEDACSSSADSGGV